MTTTMDELTVALTAREFVNQVGPISLPVSVVAYAAHIGATIKKAFDLGDGEDGFSAMKPNGKYGICVNGNQNDERQRFTVCHELAHIILGMPSEHRGGASWSYARRTPNEILCDVFAAELLLPYTLFKPLVDDVDPSLAAIDALAARCEASLLATGSRFAAMAGCPCAFVLAEGGTVRYSSPSAPLRAARGFIRPRLALPDGSIAKRCRDGYRSNGPEDVEADVWFEDWDRDAALQEDARHIAKYDQTIALLWFDDEDVPPQREDRRRHEEEEFGLAELDGNLPWPGKNRRRK